MRRPSVAYLGTAAWLVDGRRGSWAESYGYLIRVYGMRHSEAVLALVAPVHSDRAQRQDAARPHY